MTEYRASVLIGFNGVRDGEIHPRRFEPGEEVFGDLARVAIAEKWAKPFSEEKVEPKKVASDGAAAADQSHKKPEDVAVDIPADWKSSKWFALKALAEKIKGENVVDSAEAKSVIENEVARRG